MLLRLAHLAATNAFAFLRLLPVSNRDKDIEIHALRHQLLVLQRHVGKPAFTDTDRVILVGLLHHLPMDKLRQLLLRIRSTQMSAISRSQSRPSIPRRSGL